MDDIRKTRRFRPAVWVTCALLVNSVVIFAILIGRLSGFMNADLFTVGIFIGWILLWAIVSSESRELFSDGMSFIFAFFTFVFLGVVTAEEYKLLPLVMHRLPLSDEVFKILFMSGWCIGIGMLIVRFFNRRMFNTSPSK